MRVDVRLRRGGAEGLAAAHARYLEELVVHGERVALLRVDPAPRIAGRGHVLEVARPDRISDRGRVGIRGGVGIGIRRGIGIRLHGRRGERADVGVDALLACGAEGRDDRIGELAVAQRDRGGVHAP